MLNRPRSDRNFSFTPENVLTLYRRAIGIDPSMDDAACYDHSVINEHEAAEIWDAIMIVQHYRRTRVNDYPTDFVSCQLLSVAAGSFKGGRIHHFLD